jgi:hypothetical protein
MTPGEQGIGMKVMLFLGLETKVLNIEDVSEQVVRQ